MPIFYTALAAAIFALVGCDFAGRNQCQWYLTPEKEKQQTAAEGWIAVCARNFKTNKQDCRLQSKLEFAKSVYNKKFRYKDLVFADDGGRFPRKVTNIKRFCL